MLEWICDVCGKKWMCPIDSDMSPVVFTAAAEKQLMAGLKALEMTDETVTRISQIPESEN
jgi:hypothetical protein